MAHKILSYLLLVLLASLAQVQPTYAQAKTSVLTLPMHVEDSNIPVLIGLPGTATMAASAGRYSSVLLRHQDIAICPPCECTLAIDDSIDLYVRICITARCPSSNFQDDWARFCSDYISRNTAWQRIN
ncbi:MAG: hypothetical protein K1X79_02535 [Oligoflexia bacterium]|nr:hypothetical protein [Oligoflexia bacterium]